MQSMPSLWKKASYPEALYDKRGVSIDMSDCSRMQYLQAQIGTRRSRWTLHGWNHPRNAHIGTCRAASPGQASRSQSQPEKAGKKKKENPDTKPNGGVIRNNVQMHQVRQPGVMQRCWRWCRCCAPGALPRGTRRRLARKRQRLVQLQRCWNDEPLQADSTTHLSVWPASLFYSSGGGGLEK